VSSTPFMQLYVADYLADTQDLSTEEHGAYLLLLITMWRHGARLPNDGKKLARIARVSPRKWSAIWSEISRFFVERGDEITNKRLEFEHEKALAKSEKRSTAGARGGAAKALKNNKTGLANASGLPPTLPSVLPKQGQSSDVKKEPKGSQKRGTRLPPDWTLSNRNIQDAQACGLTTDEVRHEANKFRDYWISATGGKASKLDWDATWRNWCRNTAERKPSGRGQPVGNRSNGEKLANAFDELQREIRAAEDGPDPWGDDGSAHAGPVLDLESFFGSSEGRGQADG